MKKYLPIAIISFSVLFFIGVFLFIKSRNANTDLAEIEDADDELVAEIPFKNRPFTTLSPTKADKNGNYGHWLTLDIKGIKVEGATTLDYELIYKTKEGTTQGVPGSLKLDGSDITRDLLLGSESAGKFRYDEGVDQGSLTLRFRNDKGKLVGKLMTDFHLQTTDTQLSSVDSKFEFTLDKAPSKVFFVTMNTFGIASPVDFEVKDGPYGVFSSDATEYSGKVKIIDANNISRVENDNLSEVGSGSKSTIGVFISH